MLQVFGLEKKERWRENFPFRQLFGNLDEGWLFGNEMTYPAYGSCLDLEIDSLCNKK